jgi:hypothetical protein
MFFSFSRVRLDLELFNLCRAAHHVVPAPHLTAKSEAPNHTQIHTQTHTQHLAIQKTGRFVLTYVIHVVGSLLAVRVAPFLVRFFSFPSLQLDTVALYTGLDWIE